MNRGSLKFVLDKRVYNLEAILNTCYAFMDRAYIYLDSDSEGEKIAVCFKSKQKLSSAKIEQLKGEFMNELLYNSLRSTISKNNKKIREYIVCRALYSYLPSNGLDLYNDRRVSDYREDPLGIAKPWEEKYGKKGKNAKVHAKI